MSSKLSLVENYKKRSESSLSQKISVIEVEDVSEEDANDVITRKPQGWSSLNITVEPVLFTITFVQSFSQGVILNLLERNVCIQKYNLTISECKSDLINETMKTYLEGTAAEVQLAIQLIQGLCPVALSLFVGPWSDYNGRKPFILLPLAGYFLYYMLWAIMSIYPHIPIQYMFIPSIPLSLAGSVVAELVCCYCYICDIFEPENRTFRFNIAMSSFLAGGLLANFSVSSIFHAAGDYGYTLVFLISGTFAAFSFLYSWLCLEETKEKVQGKGFLITFDYAKSVLTTIFMRPKDELLVILFTVIILITEIFFKAGEGAVEYLVGKSAYSWSLQNFTNFSSFNIIIAVISSVFGSLIMKRILKLENSTIILVGAIILTLAEILRAFSSDQQMYWIATAVSKSGAIIGPTIASEMSNVVSNDDLGKVYALNALVDSGSAYLSAPVYTALYGYLLKSNGEILHVYLLSAGIAVIIIFSAIGLSCNYKRNREDSYIVNKH